MKNKNFKGLLAIVLMVLTLPLNAFANNDLTDLDAESRYYQAISAFLAEGVVKGYEDNTFKPEKEVNRAEALKIIVEGFNLSNEKQAEINFSDVGDNEWFTDYVAIGIEMGIVKGYPDGTFQASNNVNYAEALVMALRAKGVNMDEIEYLEFHPSINANDWYGKMFSYGFENNLIDLESNGSIDPGKQLSRAEIVDLAYRVKSKPINAPLDLTYNWKSNSDNDLISLKLPIEWEAYAFDQNGLFVTSDKNMSVDMFDRNSERVSILFDSSEIDPNLGADDYLNDIKESLGEEWDFYEEGKRSGKFLIAQNEEHFAFYYWVENGKVILGEAKFDEGLKGIEFEKIIRTIFSTVDLSDGAVFSTEQQQLSELRDFLLVSNKGKEIIDKFKQAEIIETDNIGVGTGPVDYYYLPSIDYTVKYERAEDIILDMQQGKTTNF